MKKLNKKITIWIIIFNVLTIIAVVDLYLTFGNDLFKPIMGQSLSNAPVLYNGDSYKEVNRLIVDADITNIHQGPNDSIIYSISNTVIRMNPPKKEVKSILTKPATALNYYNTTVYAAAQNEIYSITYTTDSAETHLLSELPENSVIVSIAADGNNLYLADFASKKVIIINKETGSKITEVQGDPAFKIPSPYFPVGLYNDQLWIADTGRHNIQIFSTNGDYKSLWQPEKQFPGCCNPIDFKILKNGNVVTLQKGICEIKIFAPTGKKIADIAPTNAFESISSRKQMAVFNENAIVVMDPDLKSMRFFIKK